MGAMSFGEKAKPLEQDDAISRMSDVSFQPADRDKKYSQTEMAPGQRAAAHGSIISIQDIQEVKDKVPASPISSTEKS